MNAALPNFASTEIKEEKNGHKLPRTVVRTNKHLLLDGDWKFAIDQNDEGLLQGWHLQHEYAHTARWPGSVENHMAGARGEAEGSWQDKVVVWYERTFEIPPRPLELSHLMYQLTFGACGYESRVWLNGIPLKTIEGEEVHYGEYTSFSYELNDSLLMPVNRLTVRIQDTMDSDLTRGKQESHVYKRGGIWYQTYTGAVRSIWLETVERNRLRSRIGVVSLVEDQLVRFNFTTRIHDPGQYNLRLTIFDNVERKGNPLAISNYSLLLEAGQKNQRVVIEVPGASLWSPEQPHLYWLTADLIDANGYTASIQAHFGLRKIEARGKYIYLNNEPIYLDGILYQPGTASYEEMRRHMEALKDLGCNLVRVHIAGVDPRIYNLADELGLLLWVEVPSPHSSTHQSRKNHWEELQRMLSLIETNPSIVMWSLYNEDWGVQDIAYSEKTRQYIIDTYHYMAIHHPQFLVVDNDGWHHISLEGRLKSDLLTAHVYTPELERWIETLDKLASGDLQNVAVFPLVIGDPFFYRGQVPLVVSEWGGFGFADYGGPADNVGRASKIKQFKGELRNRAIAGDIYTQATNIEDEKNGLIDFHTGELWVPKGLLKSEKPKKAT
jgi:beta-galactosidase/beta-glucuronidase